MASIAWTAREIIARANERRITRQDLIAGALGEISNERMNEFEADLLLVDAYFDQPILTHPLYQSHPVVEQEQVVVAGPGDRTFWGTHFPINLRAATFLLEELTATQPLDTGIVAE